MGLSKLKFPPFSIIPRHNGKSVADELRFPITPQYYNFVKQYQKEMPAMPSLVAYSKRFNIPFKEEESRYY